MRVGTSLKNVSTKRRACAKPNCNTGSRRLHRHHKRHQYMFVGAFSRTRYREARYREFVEKYYEFRPVDIVDLCEHHHAEIHAEYDKVITKHLRERRKKLYRYSWAEASDLMTKLERTFSRWVKKDTPGVDSATFRRPVQGGFQHSVADLRKQWRL